MPRNNPGKIMLKRQTEFSVEFESSTFSKEPKTDVTVYRYGHGMTITLTREEMQILRDALTSELDKQADAAMQIIEEMHLDE